MLVNLAVHGAGVVMLPAFMAEEAVAQGRLVRLLPDWHSAPLTLRLVYGTRRNQAMAVRKLIEHLVESMDAKPETATQPAPGIDTRRQAQCHAAVAACAARHAPRQACNGRDRQPTLPWLPCRLPRPCRLSQSITATEQMENPMTHTTAERNATMHARESTEAPVLSRRALILKGAALAALAAFRPAMAAALAMRRICRRRIRPFRVDVPQAALVDLRRRLAATRWPDPETVADRSQGVQLAKLQALVRYWRRITTGERQRRNSMPYRSF